MVSLISVACICGASEGGKDGKSDGKSDGKDGKGGKDGKCHSLSENTLPCAVVLENRSGCLHCRVFFLARQGWLP